MSIPNAKPLYLAKKSGEDRKIRELLTSAEWNSAFESYNSRARYHAANLAAHNWDVIQVGGRILIVCPWSGGHWLSPDCTFVPITGEEFDLLYPKVPHDTSTPEALRAWQEAVYSGDIKRQRKISLASGIEAATADETRSGSAVGESPVGNAETPTTSQGPNP